MRPSVLLIGLAGALLLSACCDEQAGLPDDLALPEAHNAVPLEPTGVRVLVSPSALRVENKKIGSHGPLTADGYPADWKGPGGLMLSGLNEELMARKKMVRTGWGHATLYVDASTPYRAFTELLYTLGQSEVSGWHVVVTRGEEHAAKRFEPPEIGMTTGWLEGTTANDVEATLAALGGSVPAPGSASAPASAAPPAAPSRDAAPLFIVTIGPRTVVARGPDGRCVAVMKDGFYDLARVASCAEAAAAKAETKVEWAYVGAAPEIKLQTVLRVVEAIESTYPKIAFTVPR